MFGFIPYLKQLLQQGEISECTSIVGQKKNQVHVVNEKTDLDAPFPNLICVFLCIGPIQSRAEGSVVTQD